MADWGLGGDGQRFVTYGALPALTAGTLAVSDATVVTNYGAWVELTTATGIAIEASAFLYTAFLSTTASNDYMVDIGVGAPGAVQAIVSKLFFFFSGSNLRGGQQVYIPLGIPAGSRVWVRVLSRVLSGALTHTITVIGRGFRSPSPLSGCITYNVNSGSAPFVNSTGGSVVALTMLEPGGTVSGTELFSVISNSVAPTTLKAPMSMALFSFSESVVGAAQPTGRWYLDIGIGAVAGTPDAIVIPNIIVDINATSDRFSQQFYGPVPLSLPAGTTVQGGVCSTLTSGGSGRTLGVIMYGFS